MCTGLRWGGRETGRPRHTGRGPSWERSPPQGAALVNMRCVQALPGWGATGTSPAPGRSELPNLCLGEKAALASFICSLNGDGPGGCQGSLRSPSPPHQTHVKCPPWAGASRAGCLPGAGVAGGLPGCPSGPCVGSTQAPGPGGHPAWWPQEQVAEGGAPEQDGVRSGLRLSQESPKSHQDQSPELQRG